MSRNLQLLLAVETPIFHNSMKALESMTGRSSVDVKLLGDILMQAHHLMRAIGVDPSNTTAEELYYALSANDFQPELFAKTHYVGLVFGDQVVSLNYQDVIKNKRRSFEDRVCDGLRQSLRAELAMRYRNHPATDNEMVEKILDELGLGSSDVEIKRKGIKVSDGRPHILAVGDIITNAFIKLSEDYFEEYTDDKGYQRLSFELGGKLPYDEVEIVKVAECSPNAAVSVSRLGLSVDLMSWIGDDEPGREMLSYLKEQNVGTDYMVIESGVKSNYHYVLRYGADRTKLQRFEDYSYIWKAPERKPDWLYLGVLGEDTWHLHEEMQRYLEENPDIKLAFQPGMYHLMWGAEKLSAFYKRADIVVMNREEAAQVTGRDRGQMRPLIEGLHELGVSIAVVTDGADGAYASDGNRILFMKNFPDPAPPFERTGAGDAFASTLVAALAMGESLETALRWAPINSAYVVQKMGAQAGLLTREELEHHLANAPEDYYPVEYQGE